jgi:FkbM family methyltransferase
VEKIYAFPFAKPDPRILDLGANIGLSAWYFKRLFPQARITAVEADPAIFRVLSHNVKALSLANVELINAAAWHEDGTMRFRSDGADGGRVSGEGQLEVPALSLARMLEGRGPFDLIKMDIEGAEDFALPSARKHLSQARFLFVEYHAAADRPQALPEILAAIKEAGFRFHVRGSTANANAQPFLGVANHCGFDLQLEIFAWRK